MSELAGIARSRALSWLWSWTGLLAIALLLSIGFLIAFALPYALFNVNFLARFDDRERFWLFSHIGAGSVALFVGPIQLWMGSTRRYMRIHRKLGKLYLLSVAVASVAALFLAPVTKRGFVFGFALGSLAVAWLIATGLAYVAVRRRLFLQHQEWMIRSYVITFAFVSFRIMVGVMKFFHMGTGAERISTASWMCWAVPLLLTEAIIQGRKIFGTRITATSRTTESDYPAKESQLVDSK